MRFEEVLPKLREGKIAKLVHTLYRIDEDGDFVSYCLGFMEEEDSISLDDVYWTMASLSSWDVTSESWKIIQDAESKA